MMTQPGLYFKVVLVLVILGMVSLLSPLARAETRSFYPVDDSFVFNANPDNNYDAWNELQVYRFSDGYRRSYLKFDLSGIPETEYITNCVLTLSWLRGTPDVSSVVNLYFVSDDNWVESEITWNNRPNPTTYGILLDSITVNPTQTNQLTFYFPATEDNDSLSLLLRLADESDTTPYKYYGFYSHEEEVTTLRPRLDVTTGVVPLPGSLLLLGTGILGLGAMGWRGKRR